MCSKLQTGWSDEKVWQSYCVFSFQSTGTKRELLKAIEGVDTVKATPLLYKSM